ncbi:hypothetical protein K9M50_03845, partial [Patescibacteria group bacterium]|nr:hypothetical protein [Patescibacteria group bacterium]
FNIFSKKKKKDSQGFIKATDFLNPRDGNSSDLDDKEEKNKKSEEKKKKEKEVTRKELKKAEKKRKAEAKQAEKKRKAEAKQAEKKRKAEAKEKRKKIEKEDQGLKDNKKKESKKNKEEEKKLEDKRIEKVEKEEEEKKEIQDKKTLEEQKTKEKEQVKSNAEKDVQGGSNHEYEKSNILEINLVKDEINVYFDWYKNIAMLIIFVFLSFILVAEIYLALSWWEDKNNSAVSQDEARFVKISEETKKIRGEVEEALSFQTKLNRANYVLDNHLYWSNFFDYLEKNTLKEVKYTSFTGDILGNFSIPATSNSFPSLGQQIYQLQSDPDTIKASIDSGEKLESEEETLEEVKFNIDLKVSPELFKK